MGFFISPSSLLQLLLLLPLLLLTTATPPSAARPPSPPPPQSPARALDALLQASAFQALSARPRTGIIYNATVPANLTGITASALRLRSGSLRRRGFPGGYRQFSIPPGITVRPHVERVVLVYQDLGSGSSARYYYPPPDGYSYLAPVLGLLAYDAANLSAVAPPELDLVVDASAAGRGRISVAFDGVVVVRAGVVPRCVVFGVDGGAPELRDVEGTNGNVCTTDRQGHVSIVVNSSEVAPSPAPPGGAIAPPIPDEGEKGSSAAAWKIAVGVVGGAVALGMVAALVLCLVRYRREKKIQVMERNAQAGETLRMAQVGRAQAPVALGTRTQPVIENDYAAA